MIPNINRNTHLPPSSQNPLPPIASAMAALNQEPLEAPALDHRVSIESKTNQSLTIYHLDKDWFAYEGEMVNGKYHGRGRFINNDGSNYKGEFKDGLRHGNGIYYFELTNFKYSLVGEFVNGDAVSGKIRFTNGSVYSGDLKNWQAHGQGAYTYRDGSTYIGEVKDGKKNGWGTLTDPHSCYEGWWENDNKVTDEKNKLP